MANRTAGALFVMAALAIPSAAMAQRFGRAPFPGSGACFFEDAHFRGEYFCVPAGESVRRVPDEMNNRISSIRIFGRAEVMVFSGDRFRGEGTSFDYDVWNLRDEWWNDRISSLRVDYVGRGGDFRGRPDDRGRFDDRDRFDDRRRDDDRRDGDIRDRRDDDRRDTRVEGETARAREIVRRAYLSVLQREPDPGAGPWVDTVIRNHWSQGDLEPVLRKSEEYREKFGTPREKAEIIVRHAYLNVLKREPDPGAAGWVDLVLRNHSTQADLERELRKTPEGRQKNPQ